MDPGLQVARYPGRGMLVLDLCQSLFQRNRVRILDNMRCASVQTTSISTWAKINEVHSFIGMRLKVRHMIAFSLPSFIFSPPLSLSSLNQGVVFFLIWKSRRSLGH
jgi:hypothetical protein